MSGPSDPTRDFVRAAEVRRAMMRAPWPPLALKLALLVFDYMGLERGRCELGLGSIAVALMSPEEFEALGALSGEVRAKRLRLAKGSLKRAARQLDDVLVTTTNGDGKRAHRTLRTDLILERWGGDHRVTPSKNAGGGDAVTPTKHEGVPHGHQGGDDLVPPRGYRTVTSYQEDLREDLLEDPDPPPTPPAGERTCDEVRGVGEGGSALPMEVEVTDLDSARRWLRQLLDRELAPILGGRLAPREEAKLLDPRRAGGESFVAWTWNRCGAEPDTFCRVLRDGLKHCKGELGNKHSPGGYAAAYLERALPALLRGDEPPTTRPGPASTRPRRVHRHAYNPEIGSDEDFAEAERLLATPKEIPRA